MGPKRFRSITLRFASPVKNHLLCLVLGQASITVYVFWIDNPMQGVAVTCVEVLSVWSVTAIAALLFPYRKRAQSIWESSPYRTWKILGIPVVSLGAGVDLVYLGIIASFFFLTPVHTEDFGLFTGMLIVFMYALGVAWYSYWKSRSKRVGLDVGLAFGQLPPE